MFKIKLKYSIPKYEEYHSNDLNKNDDMLLSEYIVIFAETNFFVKDIDIKGSFFLFFKLDSKEYFLELLNNSINKV